MTTLSRRLLAAITLTLSGAALAAPTSEATEAGRIPLRDAVFLPAPDLAKLKLEDSKADGLPYRYGIEVPVALNRNAAKTTLLADGRARLQWTVASPGAKSLDFHFARLVLPKGAELVLRGEGKDNVRVVNAADIQGDAGYWSPYVLGERASIEILVDAKHRHEVIADLAGVTHGYRGLFDRTDDVQKSGSCNVDTACPAGAGWDDQIDSVGHYTFSQGGSSYVCTGTLVGNTSNSTTPYFLTANHCVSTQTVASTIVVYWNYQSATCRTPGSSSSGTPLSRSIATHSQSGTTLRATNAASDFALLQLNATPAAGADVFYSGWDASGSTPSSAVGIHHPAGHEKRIAVEDAALQISGYGGGSGSTHWRVVDWDQGTTEGGSSGSGLWNQNKRLVGQLHGGSAACGNNLSDYYGRVSVSWTGGGTAATRLRDWLDPGNSGVTSFAGYRAGGGTPGNVAPVANFTFTTSGLTATFTNTSTDSDGAIASRSWNFGDGTTSTAASPSKTYSAAGTYNVTLTVTDDDGASNATTKSVTVTSGGGGGSVLSNGVPVTGISGAASSEQFWTINVPSGATNLVISTAGGSGDVDLYTRQGSAPTTGSYLCRPYLGGNNETCTVASPVAGTYHVMLRGYSAYSGVTLTASYSTGGGGGASFFQNTNDYTISDNATVNSPIVVSGRSGNAPSTLQVAVNIVHTYRGDLKVDLVAPDGTLYNISNRAGGSADNLVGTYTINASSEVANGTWNLRVNDNAGGDTGYINSWSLQF
ncbi:proprotein convertase P-domain-containing protein [Chiayiivirga flava]|uniref:PKD repeat protein n=1 Tax=Chiayiivirga flava TaxID=659595 RepID=A0A7W8D6K5_9GAMM|nr:proprotein convertase P-domain-containing protein [Chiayiivirga flava]MBB5208871.1 PKD repeat protein [Chiayiivirga flava]